jgi:acyl-CoA thioester hydrolase
MKIEPAKIQVRFSDCDMMGHVNNAVYLSYFEMARIYYFGILLAKDRDWKKEGVLLRKNEVEYLRPVLLHDIPEITVYLDHIGTKSFSVAYELKVNGELRTIGKSVLVCYNSIENKTFEITDELRHSLEKLRK